MSDEKILLPRFGLRGRPSRTQREVERVITPSGVQQLPCRNCGKRHALGSNEHIGSSLAPAIPYNHGQSIAQPSNAQVAVAPPLNGQPSNAREQAAHRLTTPPAAQPSSPPQTVGATSMFSPRSRAVPQQISTPTAAPQVPAAMGQVPAQAPGHFCNNCGKTVTKPCGKCNRR